MGEVNTNQVSNQKRVSPDSQSNPVKSSSKNVPTLVKVIAILHYIGAALLLSFGIFIIVSLSFLVSLFPILAMFSAFAIVFGIGFIGISILFFFIGRGLWKGKNWARIVAIVLYGLGIISSIYFLVYGNFSSIINLVIVTLIFGYLLFSKKVKEAFS